jgi:hypothetical protein
MVQRALYGNKGLKLGHKRETCLGLYDQVFSSRVEVYSLVAISYSARVTPPHVDIGVWVFFFVPFWPGSCLLLLWMFSGLFPASAANEAADDTSEHCASRLVLSAGTVPPDFTVPRFFPNSNISDFFINIFFIFSGRAT